MDYIGSVAAICSGVILGMTGVGGSVLAIPILVYLFGTKPVLASAYSLFMVGTSAVIGVFDKYKKGLVDTRTGITFAIPSLIMIYSMRYYIVPTLPTEWFSIGSAVFTKDNVTMVLLALVMLFVAIHMIRKSNKKSTTVEATQPYNRLKVITEGLAIGALSGAIGIGGGFLIVPALILHMKLPVKVAVGTALFIVAINSFVGFTGDLQQNHAMDWGFLLPFTGFMTGGTYLGSILSHHFSNDQVKRGMGWLILILALYILTKEFILHLSLN